LATRQLSITDLLTKVAEYAALAIPGAEGAGLTMIEEDRSETLVSTTQFVTDVDAIQYGIRQGPCVTATSEGTSVLSHSLGEDHRWPEFGARVTAIGVHSALSLPLITPDEVIGAMNIYARSSNVFDDRAADLGQFFAVPAAIAVQNAQLLDQTRKLATQLRAALTRSTVVDQAIGIVMSRDSISPKDARQRMDAIQRDQNQNWPR
jgi:GAF domain-containing protein